MLDVGSWKDTFWPSVVHVGGGKMNDASIMAPSISSVRTPTILVVEDDVMVRAMWSEELRAEGFTVVQATNVDEAVAVLRSTINVDIVVTDMQMPGAMDGTALVRLIRADYPFLKVVMVSGQLPDERTFEQLHGFLRKPATPSQLSSYLHLLKNSA
jgi:CheY-like chemotaxis protein